MTSSNQTRRRPAITAAGSRYQIQLSGTREAQPDDSWQAEAWGYFRTVPEVRQAASWVGNALSGAVLYAGKAGPDNSIVPAPDDHPAAELVAQIAGGPLGQSNFLAQWGPHLVVAGEGWAIIEPVLDPITKLIKSYRWRVLSTNEVQRDGRRLTARIEGREVVIPEYDPQHPDETAPVAIRVWSPAPWEYLDADSPIRSCFVILQELQLLTAAVAAITRSRITGRGILLVPKGVRFPSAASVPGDAEDDVIDVLMEVASTAIQEPDSAAATVPIVLEVPDNVIDKVRYLTFQSDFDEMAIRLREECRTRFAAGQDMPAELILGLGDTNHWSANLLTSEGVKLAVDPKLKLVTDAFTTQWLRPLLEALRVEDAEEWMVVGDTSEVKAAAARPATALEAFKLGLISAKATRRELGYSEGDAPGAEEEAENPGGEELPETPAVAEETAPADLPQDETGATPATAPGVDVIASSGVPRILRPVAVAHG